MTTISQKITCVTEKAAFGYWVFEIYPKFPCYFFIVPQKTYFIGWVPFKFSANWLRWFLFKCRNVDTFAPKLIQKLCGTPPDCETINNKHKV